MERPVEQLPQRRFFHNPAAVHHVHRVCHMGHHAQIVGDEDQGGPLLPLQALEYI